MSASKIIINNIKVKIIKENEINYYRVEDIYKIIGVKVTLKFVEIKKIEETDYIDHYYVLKLLHHYKIKKEIHDAFLQSIYDTNYYIHPIKEELETLNKPCIYIIELKNNEYKYGKSEDIKQTMIDHQSHFKKYKIKPKLIKYWIGNKVMTSNCIDEITFFIEQSKYINIDKYNISKVIKNENIEKLIQMIDNYVTKFDYNNYEILKLKHKIDEMKKLQDEYVRTIEILKRNKEIQQIDPEKIHILDDVSYKCDCGSVLKKAGKNAHENSGKHKKYIETHKIDNK